VIRDTAFDRRLAALFMTDAARGIPDGTTVLDTVGQHLGHPHRRPRQSVLRIAGIGFIALALLISVTPARAKVAQLLPFGWVQRFGTVLVTPTPVIPPGIGRRKQSVSYTHLTLPTKA